MAKVPIVIPLKASEIELKAQQLLKKFYPETLDNITPTPVDKIFEFVLPQLPIPIKCSYTSLQQLGIDAEGYTNAVNRISIIDEKIANDYSVPGRRRFRSTAGHEIGHCVLHVPLCQWQASLQTAGFGMKREQSSLRPFEDCEWQAWRFCHALCMPAQHVYAAVSMFGTGYNGITAMTDLFDMNRSFVESRLRILKLIPAVPNGDSGKKKYAWNHK